MNAPADLHLLHRRLARLEAGNRRLRGLAVAGPLLALAVVLLGQSAPSTGTLEGTELVLRDSAGRQRIVLSAKSDAEPTIGVLDRDGKLRAALTLSGDVPAVILHRADGQEGARLALEPNGPVAYLYDRNHVARTGLAILDEKYPGLFLRDENKVQRLSLTVQDGSPALFFLDTAEKSRLQLAVHEDRPLIYFNDEEQKVRMSLLVSKTGFPSINLRDVATTAQAQLAVSSRGPSFVLVDTDGNRAFDPVPLP